MPIIQKLTIWTTYIAAILLFFQTQAEAHTNLRQLSVNNGLSNYHISDIEQDGYGFLWIATYDGLNRYDGVNCKVYRHNPEKPGSLSSNRIKSLYYDSDGNRLIVGTDGGGINIYNYSSDTFDVYNIHYRSDDWLPENDIIDIKPENDGRLWIATRRTIFLTRISDGDISIEQAMSYPATRALKSLVVTNSYLYAIAQHRVVRYSKQNGIYGQDADFVLPDNVFINSVSTVSGESFLLSTGKGIYEIESKSGRMFNRKDDSLCSGGLMEDEDVSIAQIIDGRMYFYVSHKGLFCKEPDGSINSLNTTDDNFWKGNTIRLSFVDKSNTLWLGSLNKGVGAIDLDQIKYEYIDLNEDGSQPFISELMYDQNTHNLWIGTQKNGLYIREDFGKITHHFPGEGSITDIKAFSDGSVKVVCNGTVYSYANGTFEEIFPLSYKYAESAGTVFSICEDATGKIWLGCRKGLVCPDTRTYIKLETNFHLEVLSSRSGDALWVCSGRNGLFRYVLGGEDGISLSEHYITSEDSELSSNTVMTLLESSSGKIFVGTEMGLNVIDPETMKVRRLHTSKDILSSCRILSISEDGEGILWVNTHKGVVRFNPETSEEKIFDSTDGLISSYTTSASAITESDILYIGTNEGVTSFNTRQLPCKSTPPQIAVSGFRIFGEDIHFEVPIMDMERITLPYNQNNITFLLSVFSFDNPQKNLFSYRLLGYDEKWNTVGSSHPYASYSKLKKGHYTFEFKGINSSGTESDKTVSIDLVVRPAWWDTILAYFIYALLSGIFVYLGISYTKDKIRIREERKANEAKLRFYDNLTHELRTPLTLISAPLSELAEMENLPHNAKEKVTVMQRNGDRLMNLANQFLDLRKIEHDGLPLSVKYQDARLIVDGVIERFGPLARQKRIELNSSVKDGCMGFLDAEKISTILINLVSNAVKYTGQGGHISLSLKKNSGNFVFEVSDDGIGISRKDLNHIFERFYQVAKNPVSGTGIGLELSKSLAELHKGALTARSRLGEGSIFTLSIPYTKDCYKDCDIAPEQMEEADEIREISSEESEEEKIRILVVEDDIEMQQYIQSILATDYEVLVANNGKKGYETALKSMPDLIVSDVMMPVMDGIQMCRMLHENQCTSHIPVIMLTAKNDESAGLQSGAVDYILKPFVPQNLMLKIKNLMHYRNSHRLNIDSSTSISMKISEYEEQKEKEFLEKAYSIVVNHIGESEFNVNELMSELGVSKTQLHKKMTALTGAPASSFIRNIRLDKAREMLQTGRYSISEVLYSVGFASPSYFSKMFKARFGKLPSDFLEDR
ncbi:MAG: two-component regulator propeller domain-containing protein [Candidatus Cryptobacteroides sp.]